MRTVAKRLVLGMAASAEGYHCASGQAETGATRIYNLEFALDADRSIAEGHDFG